MFLRMQQEATCNLNLARQIASMQVLLTLFRSVENYGDL